MSLKAAPETKSWLITGVKGLGTVGEVEPKLVCERLTQSASIAAES